ncbi:MAG: DUF4920 domain-containing protein [Bradymonadaceae bacterium]|nr:DUF4920 domain-containing protein [Lujinxingiaceae bacterium]
MKRLTLIVLVLIAVGAWGCESKSDSPTSDQGAQAQAGIAEVEAEAEAEPTHDHDGKAKAEQAQATDLEDGEKRHFGAAFAIEGEPLTLAAALETSKESEGPYKVVATVEKVCQVKGCWFTLEADGVEVPIRVRMKDYAFFVSKNAAGSQAVLEGTLVRKKIEQKLAQHFAEDEAEASGEPARVVSGDEETFEFMASGLELIQQS